METYRFKDVLTGSWAEIDYPSLITRLAEPPEGEEAEAQGAQEQVHGVFYPGCSVLNHALPLVPHLNDMLAQAGYTDGMSVLCCGRILDFEKGTERRHAAFNNAFTDCVVERGVERLVTACPNCAETLAQVLAADPRTAHVEVLALSSVLADIGYRLDPAVVARVVAAKQKMLDDEKLQSRLIEDAIDEIYARAATDEVGTDAASLNAVDAVTAAAMTSKAAVAEVEEAVSAGMQAEGAVDAMGAGSTDDAGGGAGSAAAVAAGTDIVPLWVHRSCPDRETLMFAHGVTQLAPDGWVINENLSPSGCCGSKAQAVGRFDVAERQAQHIASRALDTGARAIVASCMSCTTSLASSQLDIPIIHYLELLFDWPIDWRAMQPGVTFRFLIEGEKEPEGFGRHFVQLPVVRNGASESKGKSSAAKRDAKKGAHAGAKKDSAQ